MTETKITEFIVGIISAGFFLWFFPIAARTESAVTIFYAENIPNLPLIVSAGTLVLCCASFGLIALYCLGACLEKVALAYIKRNKG